VGPTAGLDDLEKAKVLSLPAGTQTPDDSACSLVKYWLHYTGSVVHTASVLRLQMSR